MDEEEEESRSMRPSGWAFLILSWGSIVTLTVFCFYRILVNKKIK